MRKIKKNILACAVLALPLAGNAANCNFVKDSMAGKVHDSSCNVESYDSGVLKNDFDRLKFYKLSVEKNAIVFDWYLKNKYTFVQAAASLAKWYRSPGYYRQAFNKYLPDDFERENVKKSFKMMEGLRKKAKKTICSIDTIVFDYLDIDFAADERLDYHPVKISLSPKSGYYTHGNFITVFRSELQSKLMKNCSGKVSKKELAKLMSELDGLSAHPTVVDLDSIDDDELVSAKANLYVEIEKITEKFSPGLLR